MSLTGTNLISSIVLGLFWFFLASILNPEEYGEIGFLFSIVNVAFAVALMGLGQTVAVYEAKGENIFPASFFLVLISSSIAGIISYFFTQNIFVSLLVVGFGIFFIVQAGLQGKERFRDISINRILRAVISVGVALVLYQFLGINGLLFGYFLATLLVLRDLLPLINKRKIDLSILRSKLRFIIPSLGSRIANVLIIWGDKIIVGSLFGMSILGNYHFAFQYFLLLNAIPKGVVTFLIPQEATNQSNKKIKIFIILVSFVIALISIVTIPIVINSLLSEYHESVLPMQILSVAIVPYIINAIQTSKFLGKEESRLVLISRIIQAIMYFSLIIWLGTDYGLIGLTIGFLIAAIGKVISDFVIGKHFQIDVKN